MWEEGKGTNLKLQHLFGPVSLPADHGRLTYTHSPNLSNLTTRKSSDLKDPTRPRNTFSTVHKTTLDLEALTLLFSSSFHHSTTQLPSLSLQHLRRVPRHSLQQLLPLLPLLLLLSLSPSLPLSLLYLFILSICRPRYISGSP